MAIGISGTNSNSSSVQVSVGPAGFVHTKDIQGFLSIPSESGLRTILIGCFDPANRKCYSGGGTSATDFISGINYTITGNSNNDTIYKPDNVGIIELTGGGYIRSNGSYKQNRFTSVGGESNTVEIWIWPSTGPTQDEAILQLRNKNSSGEYKNGYTLFRRFFGNNRQLRIEGYRNDGQSVGFTNIATNALWLDTWNRIHIYDWRTNNDSTSKIFDIYIKSPYHEYVSTNTLTVAVLQGTDAKQYDINVERELTIGKAEGTTGTFHGKIGCTKIFEGPIFSNNNDSPETNGYGDAKDWTYYPLAPRYDQYL